MNLLSFEMHFRRKVRLGKGCIICRFFHSLDKIGVVYNVPQRDGWTVFGLLESANFYAFIYKKSGIVDKHVKTNYNLQSTKTKVNIFVVTGRSFVNYCIALYQHECVKFAAIYGACCSQM